MSAWLGQDAAGAGELTKFVGVDASHRRARGQQDSDNAALVAATGLNAKCGNREAAQPVIKTFAAPSTANLSRLKVSEERTRR